LGKKKINKKTTFGKIGHTVCRMVRESCASLALLQVCRALNGSPSLALLCLQILFFLCPKSLCIWQRALDHFMKAVLVSNPLKSLFKKKNNKTTRKPSKTEKEKNAQLWTFGVAQQSSEKV